MKHRKALAALVPLLCTALCACAQTPLRWAFEASRPVSPAWEVYHGESATLEPTILHGGEPAVYATNAVATLYYQTNGMAASWWSAEASIVSNRVVAPWTAALDSGADAYRFFIRIESGESAVSYRANGTLKMFDSPGFTPNAQPVPAPVLDFGSIAVLNPPWATPVDVAAAIAGISVAESDPVAGAALGAHVAHTDNPHGVTAAQAGALPAGFSATGTVARASVVGIGDTWVAASNGTATLNYPGREAGVYGDGDQIIVSATSGEGYNGPAYGTVFAISTYDAPVSTYTAGVWRIQVNSSAATVDIDREPDRRTWHAESSIPAPGHLDVLPDEFDENAVGTVSLSWYGVGVISDPIVTLPSMTEALAGKLAAEDMPGFGYAESNWVESVRGVYPDVVSNVVWHLVVSNGHWLVISEEL